MLHQLIRNFHVNRHPYLVVDTARMTEQLAGFVVIAGSVAFEQHPGPPAGDVRLVDPMRDLVGLLTCSREMNLGVRPAPACRGRAQREHAPIRRGEVLLHDDGPSVT